MSPTPAEVRKDRIRDLVQFGEKFSEERWYDRAKIDALFREAMRLHPHVRADTLMSYAQAALRILEAKED